MLAACFYAAVGHPAARGLVNPVGGPHSMASAAEDLGLGRGLSTADAKLSAAGFIPYFSYGGKLVRSFRPAARRPWPRCAPRHAPPRLAHPAALPRRRRA